MRRTAELTMGPLGRAAFEPKLNRETNFLPWLRLEVQDFG
jgi:hypothetical protein